MAKLSPQDLLPQQRRDIEAEVVAIIGAARNSRALQQLLSNLLTPSEFIMIGRRIMIAERLLQEKTYEEIRQELKVGLSTIMGVQKWLERGRDDVQLKTKKSQPKRHSYKTPYIVGSPEHGLSIIGARLGLLCFLLEGLDYIARTSETKKAHP